MYSQIKSPSNDQSTNYANRRKKSSLRATTCIRRQHRFTIVTIGFFKIGETAASGWTGWRLNLVFGTPLLVIFLKNRLPRKFQRKCYERTHDKYCPCAVKDSVVWTKHVSHHSWKKAKMPIGNSQRSFVDFVLSQFWRILYWLLFTFICRGRLSWTADCFYRKKLV